MRFWAMKRGGMLYPASDEDREIMAKVRVGVPLRVDAVRPVNKRFHRKMMALFQAGFEFWEPGEVEVRPGVKIVPEKDLNEYRYYMTIRAGHYRYVGYPDGSVRARAKSLRFDNDEMDEEARDALFNRVIDLILKDLGDTGLTRDDLETRVEQILGFA